jgi:hypothetical protein
LRNPFFEIFKQKTEKEEKTKLRQSFKNFQLENDKQTKQKGILKKKGKQNFKYLLILFLVKKKTDQILILSFKVQ